MNFWTRTLFKKNMQIGHSDHKSNNWKSSILFVQSEKDNCECTINWNII
jgi:hypothetical protein